MDDSSDVLEQSVFGSRLVVPFIWLARRLQLGASEAKRALADFAASHAEPGKLSVWHALTGTVGGSHTVVIVPAASLAGASLAAAAVFATVSAAVRARARAEYLH